MNEAEIKAIVEKVLDRMLAAGGSTAAGASAASGDASARATTPGTSASTPHGQGTGPARTVALGSDHGGFDQKQELKTHLQSKGWQVIDQGCHSKDAVDYPDIAAAVAKAVASGQATRGIVLDGAGIGSCMAANKIKGIRAALCYNEKTVINSVSHNNANILTMGAPYHSPTELASLVDLWLGTQFEGGRHEKRVAKIMQLENSCSCKTNCECKKS